MLDADTKNRINTARSILVGKLPDPQSQVEQITIALVYKFMDDMDADSEELGGKRKFFSGEFAQYGWAKLLHSGLGGHETLNLYSEAIARMPQNDGIPVLFRNIFKNAYLPYKDPETLKSFLKVIDEFTYDHSERLGDAFEFLLSIMGSQGDAGQFRTPRHIIDFIVKIIDPACGTAGFAISAYKHILKANTDTIGALKLTPKEKGIIAQNFKGYDISPDMVRLSLVNLYLHGFSEPSIDEYDSLSYDDKWNEVADVFFANPPFFSPKGGIKPHNRFTIKSKRAEVLFTDYIAQHLTPKGRAGIIVPEGIIFQSQNAYKQLRKMLVEDYLVAVVSLPAGVFNPYSGVKTSILILDKSLAKQSDTFGFFKVDNDGFNLGAQRREIDKNDFPQVHTEIAEYLEKLRSRESVENFKPTLGLVVSKERVAENGEYNLSGERYKESIARQSVFPLRKFEDVCTFEYGASLPKSARVKGEYPVIGSNGVTGFHNEFIVNGPAIIVGRKGSAGEVVFIEKNCFPIDTTYYVKQTNQDESLLPYLYWILKNLNLQELKGGAGIPGLNRNDVYNKHKIPLPPLEIQKEIVAEIEGYQKVIDGARAVVDNYRPQVAIDPDWPMVELGEVCNVQSGGTPSRSKAEYWNGKIPWVGSTVCKDTEVDKAEEFITEIGLDKSAAKLFSAGTTLIALVGATIGKTGFLKIESTTNQNIAGLHPKSRDSVNPSYLFYATQTLYPNFIRLGEGKFRMANLSFVKEQKIPLPPLETQNQIVTEIEAEQALINSNRELIERFEKKIQDAIARVWVEDQAALVGEGS
jgi:type I restriction enzyme M protein